ALSHLHLEDDKAKLVEETGLQLKQINNWFINQRKRNWHNNLERAYLLAITEVLESFPLTFSIAKGIPVPSQVGSWFSLHWSCLFVCNNNFNWLQAVSPLRGSDSL
ncbi:hypothetical protein VIGAN_11226600, partial [Vigna angularis var. angularis]